MARMVGGFVPFLPESVLSPNRGERKAGRLPAMISDAKRQFRGDTCTWLLTLPQVKAIPTPFAYARLSCIYHSMEARSDGLYRPDDASNAVYAHKAFFDGFKDAGLIVDDDYTHLELGIQRVARCGTRAEEGVEFLLEEVVE